MFSQVLCSFSSNLLCGIIFFPGGPSCLQTCTKNQITAAAFHPGLCGGEDPRAQMTSAAVLGRRDPPSRRRWDTGPLAPLSSRSPQCPGLVFAALPPAGRAGHLLQSTRVTSITHTLTPSTCSRRRRAAASSPRPAVSIVWDLQPNAVDLF